MKTTIKLKIDRRIKARSLHIEGLGTTFDVRAADDVATLTIYDEIGEFGVSARTVREALDGIEAGRINLRLNSPGGDVFDGIAIYNDLLKHSAEVHVEITGVAASAASIIAMAGDRITMAENSFLMIHNAWALTMGDRRDMEEMAAVLAKIDGALAQTYAAHTDLPMADIRAMMDAETWLDAEGAVEKGFANAVEDEEQPQALFDLSIYAKVPGPVKRMIEAGLREAGFTRSQREQATREGFSALRNSLQRDADGDEEDIQALERLIGVLA